MVELEMDLGVLVSAIKASSSSLVCEPRFKELNLLPQKDWEVRVSLNYRDGNRSADWLADAGFSTVYIEIHNLFRTLLGWLCPVFVVCDFFFLGILSEKTTTRHNIIDRETR